MHERDSPISSAAAARTPASAADTIASSRPSTSDSGMRSSAHSSFRPTTISASPIATASSQLPASASGSPGACQQRVCVGHFCMCRQRCLILAEGRPVSVISTVTPNAKASVSTVASPLSMLPHGRAGGSE
eukprot:scaffold45353_cov61-Phaeocystis_antarctica.AAC.5